MSRLPRVPNRAHWRMQVLAVAVALVALVTVVQSAVPLPAGGQNYDVLIRNGHIVDGTGSPVVRRRLAIRDGHIAAIGHLDAATAKQTIDAAGMVVAPGFIDMLGQSELSILVNPHLPSKIYQGITTEITGEGESAAPLTDAIRSADHGDYAHYNSTPMWNTFRQSFRAAGKTRHGHQPWQLRRSHAGAPRGSGRCRPRPHARRTRSHEGRWSARP